MASSPVQIVVALQTCNRHDYTQWTLESFARHNDMSRFILLHGDDCSDDERVPVLPAEYGFRTVLRTARRHGWLATRRALLEVAAQMAPWVFLLENDIETVRPFPWALFDFVQQYPDVYCLRLYGQFKGRGDQPCLTTHKREGHAPVRWRPFRDAPVKSQVGRIHWSAQPCVTRSQDVLELHRRGTEPPGLTVRVKQNVTVHIGAERTAPPVVELEAAC